MVSVLNFKAFDKGSIMGFFDLRYHGLTIKGCRLMKGNNGLWFSFPQAKGEQNGENKYFDQMFLSALEREHVRTLIIAQLHAESHLVEQQQSRTQQRPNYRPQNEDLADYRSPVIDDIPY